MTAAPARCVSIAFARRIAIPVDGRLACVNVIDVTRAGECGVSPFEKRKMLSGEGTYDSGHIPRVVLWRLVEPSRCAAHASVDILEISGLTPEVMRKSHAKIKFGSLVSGNFVDFENQHNLLAL